MLKMSSVNNNDIDNDIANDDVFAVSNFSDPFYSAFKSWPSSKFADRF